MPKLNLFQPVFLLLLLLVIQSCGGGVGGGSTNDNSSTTLLACQFNGTSIASGSSVTAYQSSSVTNGNSCASEVRSCTNGSLSGSYTFSGCTVAGDTTAPTVTIVKPENNRSIVGTAVYELTFSEAVSGLSGNNLAAACEGNVQLTAVLGGNCYPISISTNDNVAWTVDPDGELSNGDYLFQVLPAGIVDLSSNNLAAGDSVEFRIEDAVSTVANELSSDLQTAGFSESLAESVKAAVRSETASVTNNLLNVIPAAFDGTYEAILVAGLSETQTAEALGVVLESLMANISGQSSLTNSASEARVAVLPSEFENLLSSLSTKVATKAGNNSAALQNLTGALVRSLEKTGAVGEEIQTTYVATIVQTTTTVVMQRSAAERDNLLGAIGKGVVQGARQISTVTVSVAAVVTATTSTMSAAALSVDSEYTVPASLTNELTAIAEDLIAPSLNVSVNDNEPLGSNDVSLNLSYSDGQTGVVGYFLATSPTAEKIFIEVAVGSTETTVTFEGLSEGENAIYAYVQDEAGNISEAVAIQVTVQTSCEFNNQSVSTGAQVIAYQTESVPFGSSCVSEIRSCTNGELSGSYSFNSCEEQAAASCELNGQTILDGDNMTVYSTATVPFGSSCVSEIRSCTNGELSGSYSFESCTENEAPTIDLTSSSFTEGGSIPDHFACSPTNFDDGGISPALNWEGNLLDAQSFALIVDDPDAPDGVFTHWVLYNISTDTRSLAENVRSTSLDTLGAIQGLNDFGLEGYFGPCPPLGETHQYRFTIYALDGVLGTTVLSREELLAEMTGKILAQDTYVGSYGQTVGNQKPVAEGKELTVSQSETTVQVQLSGSDPDGDSFTFE